MPGRPTITPPPPAVTALGVICLVLVVITASVWAGAGSTRRELRIARAELTAATDRADGAQSELADLRSELQARQGQIEDLEDQLAGAPTTPPTTTPAPSGAPTPDPSASESPRPDIDLAAITQLIASTPDVSRAIHVTDVVDGNTLVGFDLVEMLSAGSSAGATVLVRLALTNAPAEGDCRHTQSTSLATAWLEATSSDVLLRRPASLPATDELGRELAEVLATSNPASSLNVTLVVAGEAVIDEPAVASDPGLAERLRSAQASAESSGSGVWGCARSALLEASAAEATPTPAPPEATPAATPTPSPAST